MCTSARARPSSSPPPTSSTGPFAIFRCPSAVISLPFAVFLPSFYCTPHGEPPWRHNGLQLSVIHTQNPWCNCKLTSGPLGLWWRFRWPTAALHMRNPCSHVHEETSLQLLSSPVVVQSLDARAAAEAIQWPTAAFYARRTPGATVSCKLTAATSCQLPTDALPEGLRLRVLVAAADIPELNDFGRRRCRGCVHGRDGGER